MFYLIISTLGSVLTVFIYLFREWKIIKGRKIMFLYPFLLIFFLIISSHQYYQLNELKKIENEAIKISKKWPSAEKVKYLTKGERIGIIMAGQIFLEKNRKLFPDTYNDYRILKESRLRIYNSPKEDYNIFDEQNDLEYICIATITVVKNISNQ